MSSISIAVTLLITSTALAANQTKPSAAVVSGEVRQMGFVLAEKGNFSEAEIAYRYLFRAGEANREEGVLLLCTKGKDSKVTGITYVFPARANTSAESRAHTVFIKLSGMVTSHAGVEERSTFFAMLIEEVMLTTSFRGELDEVTFVALSKNGKIAINMGDD